MTTIEPEWDDQAREQAEALEIYEATLCPSCKQPAHICQDPANEFAFEADGPYRCHASTVLEKAADNYGEGADSPALLWSSRLRETR